MSNYKRAFHSENITNKLKYLEHQIDTKKLRESRVQQYRQTLHKIRQKEADVRRSLCDLSTLKENVNPIAESPQPDEEMTIEETSFPCEENMTISRNYSASEIEQRASESEAYCDYLIKMCDVWIYCPFCGTMYMEAEPYRAVCKNCQTCVKLPFESAYDFERMCQEQRNRHKEICNGQHCFVNCPDDVDGKLTSVIMMCSDCDIMEPTY